MKNSRNRQPGLNGARRTERSGRGQEGFSLIEVVVSLGILTIGITSVIALFTSATAAHRRAVHRIQAADLAEWALADIESALRNGVEPQRIVESPPVEVLKRDWPGYDVEVAMLPILGESGSDEILVKVEITWNARGKRNGLTFDQIVVRKAKIR